MVRQGCKHESYERTLPKKKKTLFSPDLSDSILEIVVILLAAWRIG